MNQATGQIDEILFKLLANKVSTSSDTRHLMAYMKVNFNFESINRLSLNTADSGLSFCGPKRTLPANIPKVGLAAARLSHGALEAFVRSDGDLANTVRETVWVFCRYEVQLDGTKRYRKAVIGSTDEYKTEAEAQKAADALRLEINEQTPRQLLRAISFETLIEHYELHELPDIVEGTRPIASYAGEDETRKSFSTQARYAGYLCKWILPRWRSYRLGDVKAVQVEQWLKSLSLSRGSKAKIRNIMSALYSHAQRWEWATSNPIRHVRQSAKRSRIPTVLTPDQLKEFLSRLIDPAKTAVLLGAVTGLRAGELLGLKWSDIDFEKLEILLIRDVVKQRIERCKTEASKKPIPIDAALAETLGRGGSIAPTTRRTIGSLPVSRSGGDSRTGQARCTGFT